MPYVKASTLNDLWSGEMLGCEVNHAKVLFINLDNVVTAYENRCAHLGVALSEGRLDGHVLTCRAHQWQYDARSGRGINPASACLKSFAVKVVGDDIYVDVDAIG